MLQGSQGSLTILDGHTAVPKVFQNGTQVAGGPESISEAVFFNAEILAVR